MRELLRDAMFGETTYCGDCLLYALFTSPWLPELNEERRIHGMRDARLDLDLGVSL